MSRRPYDEPLRPSFRESKRVTRGESQTKESLHELRSERDCRFDDRPHEGAVPRAVARYTSVPG